MSRHRFAGLLLGTGLVLAGGRLQAADAAPQMQNATAQTREEAVAGEAASGEAEAQTRTPEAQGAESAQAPAEEQGTLAVTPGSRALGMSILGNQEAPTSLVIVPWKSSEPGASLGISTMLDDSRGPVDTEVFLRALRYYEIRSKTEP